ncbi:type II toxin-antitoxin system VapC family toxin [candidate division TA06 bacterium]|nr:type II toxin-antitoxin system VapC family toxin [candidate division TA06 bacterium]
MNQISLRLEEVENGTILVIDANIFIYHFVGRSHSCRDLLKRCSSGLIRGITPITVLHEVTHRLMISEAQERGFIRGTRPAQQLAKNPEIVKKLHLYRVRTLAILAMKIGIAPVSFRDVVRGLELSKSYGFLTLDSILLAIMERSGIHHIASADKIFSSVEGITHFRPKDIQTAGKS